MRVTLADSLALDHDFYPTLGSHVWRDSLRPLLGVSSHSLAFRHRNFFGSLPWVSLPVVPAHPCLENRVSEMRGRFASQPLSNVGLLPLAIYTTDDRLDDGNRLLKRPCADGRIHHSCLALFTRLRRLAVAQIDRVRGAYLPRRFQPILKAEPRHLQLLCQLLVREAAPLEYPQLLRPTRARQGDVVEASVASGTSFAPMMCRG